jgi:hypothetical protein
LEICTPIFLYTYKKNNVAKKKKQSYKKQDTVD